MNQIDETKSVLFELKEQNNRIVQYMVELEKRESDIRFFVVLTMGIYLNKIWIYQNNIVY